MPSDTKFEITARSIDFGSRVVAVRHIVSAACTRGRPFFVFGLGMIAAALALLAYDLVAGKGMTALRTGGSTVVWFALIALGIGIFSLVFQRRTLTIALADGGKIRLPAGRDDFMRSVVQRLAETINADGHPSPRYRVDMAAETVEILSEVTMTTARQQPARAEPPGFAPTAVPPALDQTYVPSHDPAGPAPFNGAAHYQASNAAQSGDGFVNGAAPWGLNGSQAAHTGHPPQVSKGAQPPAYPGLAAGGNGAAAAHVNGLSIGQPGRAAPAHGRAVQTIPPNPKREIDALIAFILRSDIQHKSALLDLINVVDDHVKGGDTSRADAVAHWQSFSSYVDQYLGNVEGLAPLTRRVGRNFTHA